MITRKKRSSPYQKKSVPNCCHRPPTAPIPSTLVFHHPPTTTKTYLLVSKFFSPFWTHCPKKNPRRRAPTAPHPHSFHIRQLSSACSTSISYPFSTTAPRASPFCRNSVRDG